MRILITGAKGQLGNACRERFGLSHQLLALDLPELDITDQTAVFGVVNSFHPEIIINCAAFTRVDDCETEFRLAHRINVTGPQHLAAALAPSGGKLIHISTDYVFDGLKPIGRSYSESDRPNPISAYGRTKAEGEAMVRRRMANHLIVRTAWLYGRHGHNFIKTILNLALNQPNKRIAIVDDQFGCPTWADTLAQQLVRLVNADCRGTYHAVGEGGCSWYELAHYFLEKIGVSHRVVPCSTAQYPTRAKRPVNAVLDNRRLKAKGLNQMRPWQADIDCFVAQYAKLLLEPVKPGS